MTRIPKMLGLPEGLVGILMTLLGALLGATLVRGILLWRRPGPETRRGWRSLAPWWVLLLLLVGILAAGPHVAVLVLAILSFLLLKESLSVLSNSSLLLPMTPLTGGLFLWAWLDWPSLLLLFLPIALPAATILLMGLARGLGEVWRDGPWILLAFAMSVVGPLYVVGIIRFPFPGEEIGGWAGPLLGLLVLTELNDMAQAWWGRALGERALAPEVSPGKTWEGSGGGVGTTVLVGGFLLPVVSPYGQVAPPGVANGIPPVVWPVVAAAVIALVGVAGDLSASSLKRRGGVKDSGQLLPAHGGVLDRFDSLAVTAPAVYVLSSSLW